MQQRLQRPKVALWTRERIDLLTTIEVRQLHANALRLGEPEIATICDTVLSSRRGRKPVAGQPEQGRESSLVWVTTLDQAEPMAGADVAVMDCAGKVLWRGRTDADGIARIDAELAAATDNPACAFELPDHDTSQLGALRRLGEGLFITAETSDDMSFVHSSWDEGIEAWRFKLPAEYGAGPVIAHTIFDRSLLRAGETVHMKHLIRRHTMDGFAVPQADRLPDTASIRHAGSKQAYEMPLTWDASGVAETDWSIPKEAKLGSYSVTLMRKSREPDPPAEGEETGEDVGEESSEFAIFRSLTSGRFRVE